MFNYNIWEELYLKLYILYFQCSVDASHKCVFTGQQTVGKRPRKECWTHPHPCQMAGVVERWRTETACNTAGDRQGAVVARRKDACWGLWCPVREGLLLKGEEAQSDTELVLLPPQSSSSHEQNVPDRQSFDLRPWKEKKLFTKANS